MIHSDLFPHNFSCVKLVCPYWRITPGHQRSWWRRLFWFDGQARWNWSCCDCHWCSHFLRKGCTPCWLDEPSWPFPEGKIDSSISYACILDRIVNVNHCLYLLLDWCRSWRLLGTSVYAQLLWECLLRSLSCILFSTGRTALGSTISSSFSLEASP